VVSKENFKRERRFKMNAKVLGLFSCMLLVAVMSIAAGYGETRNGDLSTARGLEAFMQVFPLAGQGYDLIDYDVTPRAAAPGDIVLITATVKNNTPDPIRVGFKFGHTCNPNIMDQEADILPGDSHTFGGYVMVPLHLKPGSYPIYVYNDGVLIDTIMFTVL